MESIAILPPQMSPTLFDKPASPPQISDDFLSKLKIDPMEFIDSQEDSLTKDTNTPKEFNRFEENPTTSIGLLDKKIKKLEKSQKKNLKEDHSMGMTNVRDRRSVKKPVNEYETIRAQEAERQKTRRTKKKQQRLMMDTPITTGDIQATTTDLSFSETPEDSYKWRDWNLFFNQELGKLSAHQLFDFFNKVYNEHPEYISFEKGYGELRIGGQQDTDAMESRLPEQIAVIQLFCGYIEIIKKTKGNVQH